VRVVAVETINTLEEGVIGRCVALSRSRHVTSRHIDIARSRGVGT